jgi:hypothetical protein
MSAEEARYWVMWHGGYDRHAHRSMDDAVRYTQTREGRE